MGICSGLGEKSGLGLEGKIDESWGARLDGEEGGEQVSGRLAQASFWMPEAATRVSYLPGAVDDFGTYRFKATSDFTSVLLQTELPSLINIKYFDMYSILVSVIGTI